MNLSFSNLVWDRSQDEEVAEILRAEGIRVVDLVPGKYFSSVAAATDSQVSEVRAWWAQRGFQIYGLQSLLFGTSGLNVFGTPDVQQRLLEHLDHTFRIADGLGARRLVFGSPKNRDRSGLDDDTAEAMALAFFRRVGDLASRRDLLLCLEPNPVRFGTNFLTTTEEALGFVQRLNHPHVRLQLDTGTLQSNGEDSSQLFAMALPWVGHFHASEPGLVAYGRGGVDHAKVGQVLRSLGWTGTVTLEMLARPEEALEPMLRNICREAQRAYGNSAALLAVDRDVPDFVSIFWEGRTKSACVVIPVINEGQRIRTLLERMANLGLPESADLVIVDGGSNDGSLEPSVLRGLGVRGLILKTGPGKLGAQLRCAYAFALDQGFESIVTIDGNNKDDPAAIPQFLEELDRGYDFVQASRYLPGGRGIRTPWSRELAIRWIHAPLLSWSSGFRWTDTTQGFRGYSRRLLLDSRVAPFRPVFQGYELLAYLSHRVPLLGYRCLEVPTTREYPVGKVPTKISPIRGIVDVLLVLIRTVCGRYDP